MWGSPAIKQRLWNKEFARGDWDHIENTASDCVYRYVEKYCCHGAILDMGCGSGNTANELDINSYTEYLGVDISDVAIRKAAERSVRNNRGDKNHWLRSDITSFCPSKRYHVILFRESIYYLSMKQIADTFAKLKGCLEEQGVFIVRMYDRERSSYIVSFLKQHFQLIEEYVTVDSNTTVLVFR